VTTEAGLERLLLEHIREVPDFPTPGVLFKDIAPLLSDGPALSSVIGALAERYSGRIDAAVGIEARGFVLAAPLAVALGVGFVPVRKAGKLPGRTLMGTYALEYGTASIEVQSDAFRPGQRVVVIDDGGGGVRAGGTGRGRGGRGRRADGARLPGRARAAGPAVRPQPGQRVGQRLAPACVEWTCEALRPHARRCHG